MIIRRTAVVLALTTYGRNARPALTGHLSC
jgi:hypothetical protein